MSHHTDFPAAVDGVVYKYALSDDVLLSHDAVVTTISTTYVKVKAIILDSLTVSPETIRIRFEIMRDGTGTAYAKIYKNGVAVGIERTNNSGTYKGFSEDLLFAEGDTCELWIRINHYPPTAYARNFRILGSKKKAGTSGDVIEGTNN